MNEYVFDQEGVSKLSREDLEKYYRWTHESLAAFREKFEARSNSEALDGIDQLKSRLEENKRYLERFQRPYPIMNGPTVPWAVIAPHEAQCQRNHSKQTLEGIANRGGLSAFEAWAVVTDRDLITCSKEEGGVNNCEKKWRQFALENNPGILKFPLELVMLREIRERAQCLPLLLPLNKEVTQLELWKKFDDAISTYNNAERDSR